MIFLRTFFLICALARYISESLSSQELKNRQFRTSNRYQVGHQSKSFELQFPLPREYEFGKKFRYENAEPPVVVARTEGRVQRRGETANIHNELVQKRGHKGNIKTSAAELRSNRPRGGCRECPSDQRVVASKGSASALLPEPCPFAPRMWNHHSGPRPGSNIQEGVHAIRGSIGQKNKFCEYSYQLIVNRCEPLKANEEDTTIECSADNLWGSVCVISCGEEKEALGPNETECKEDLTWSNPMPICKNKMDCSIPKLKKKSNVSCRTANMSIVENDILPSGTICKFKQNGKPLSITCKDGRWLKSRKSVLPVLKQNKINGKAKKNDACNPSPCKNGGTCLKPQSNKGVAICKCRPQTQGAQCELRECYYNTCENEGLCIYQNGESTCYCPQQYGGNRCQYYITPNS